MIVYIISNVSGDGIYSAIPQSVWRFINRCLWRQLQHIIGNATLVVDKERKYTRLFPPTQNLYKAISSQEFKHYELHSVS